MLIVQQVQQVFCVSKVKTICYSQQIAVLNQYINCLEICTSVQKILCTFQAFSLTRVGIVCDMVVVYMKDTDVNPYTFIQTNRSVDLVGTSETTMVIVPCLVKVDVDGLKIMSVMSVGLKSTNSSTTNS